jgi:TRAP-type C4-dicarboxylate transport system permease small subunit
VEPGLPPRRPPPARRGLALLVERAAAAWALCGGLVLLGVVGVHVASVLSRALGGRPVAAAFELTELGVAAAAFAFLPYCQMTGANVVADVFTARASPRAQAALAFVASAAALGFALLLAQRMYLGLLDQRAFGYATTILHAPVWWVFAVAVASLALLAAAAAVTLAESLREVVRGR